MKSSHVKRSSETKPKNESTEIIDGKCLGKTSNDVGKKVKT